MSRQATHISTLVAAAVAVVLNTAPVTTAHQVGLEIQQEVRSAGPLTLVDATVRQVGPKIRLSIETLGEWTAAQLDPVGPTAVRTLCLLLFRSRAASPADSVPRARVCVARRTRLSLIYQRLGTDGSIRSSNRVHATVSRRSRKTIDAVLDPSTIGLTLGTYRWRVTTGWSGKKCPADQEPCQDARPAQGTRRTVLRRAVLAGCKPKPPLLRRHAGSSERQVALTFDDGPSAYTETVASILRRHGATATFFAVGSRVAERSAVLGRLVRDGNELGNHSYSHESLPDVGSIAATNARVRSATGYTPCLFRPPYGAIDGWLAPDRSRATDVGLRLIGRAGHLGMMTILWDVDPADWSTPGTSSIVARVLGRVHPGAIVLLHDGGGYRGQTVAALGPILSGLKRRGYSAVTVSKAVGLAPTWRLSGTR